MHLLKAGTISVADLGRSRDLYEHWLDYRTLEQGKVEPALGRQLGRTRRRRRSLRRAAAGFRCGNLPALGAGAAGAGLQAPGHLWLGGLEFCVQDVLAVNERMLESPFEIIGPPRRIEGLAAIYPMQVRGPDGEICYFTQINSDLPEFKLPRAKLSSTICSSTCWRPATCGRRSGGWCSISASPSVGRRWRSFTPCWPRLSARPWISSTPSQRWSTARTFFLEVDQMPPQASPRPRHEGLLPPGVALTTFKIADLDAVTGPSSPPRKPMAAFCIKGGAAPRSRTRTAPCLNWWRRASQHPLPRALRPHCKVANTKCHLSRANAITQRSERLDELGGLRRHPAP